MEIYNTLSGKKEEFKPIEPDKVKMYVCGPTVYNYIHIGNARPFVIFDTVRRYFEYKGYDVNFVQNFTDIDDKIIKRAIEENSDMPTVSNKYIDEFFKDTDGLNIKRAVVNPRVTNEISAIIDMIDTLIKKGFAYEIDGTVYFETSKSPDYGKLSGKNLSELKSGARVAVEESKRSPLDFVLWKPAKPQEPKWDSPWSEGRPGWHIECSVMAKKYLGETIDIHAGGEDLIFPHHENEIAQSECANGVPFSRYWMHNGMINIDNRKMSKSEGNFFTVRDIAEEFHYDVIRFFLMNGHYRMPLNFSRELLKASENSLSRIRNCLNELEYVSAHSESGEFSDNEKSLVQETDKLCRYFEESMDDDFNTANALTAIFEYVTFAHAHKNEASRPFAEYMLNGIRTLCGVLGIREASDTAITDDAQIMLIEDLIQKRNNARAEKNWTAADQIRNELTAMGITLKDTPNGVKWSLEGK